MTESYAQEYLAGETAMWFQRSCGDALEFQGCHNLTGVSVPRGDRNPTHCREGKNNFVVKRTYRGVAPLGTATLVAKDTVLNTLQEMPCDGTLYVMYSADGADEDVDNYDYFYMYEGYAVDSEDTDPQVAGVSGEAQGSVMLNMPSSFWARYKVKRLSAQSVDVSSITTNDLNAITFCDEASCDNYGKLDTLGCQTGFIFSDGTTAKIGKTVDGGGTWSSISSPFTNADDNIIAGQCKGAVVIAVNGTTPSYAYSWDTGVTWTEITTPTQLINNLMMLSSATIWFVAQGGYVYRSQNKGASITTMAAGSPTTQSLNDISAKDSLTLYAVGDSNSFIRTTDGGSTWELVTGPAAAIFPNDLYRVKAVPNTDVVFVGDEQGNVYRSEDNGDNWVTALSDSALAGGIYGIVAPHCNLVAVAGNDADPYFYGTGNGAVFASIDGGNSFLPLELPSNTGILNMISCGPNKYWIVGVAGFVALISGPSL